MNGNREKKRVYISGPMRGQPDLNRAAFAAEEAWLEQHGYEPINPHNMDGGEVPEGGEELEEFAREAIRRDLDLLTGLGRPANPPDMVLLLPGWEASKGARAEACVASALGIPIFIRRGQALVPVEIGKPSQVEEQDRITEGMREFETGAKRESKKGKGRYDLISPFAMRRLAVRLEKGAGTHGDRNWEKGMPLGQFLDSAIRHIEETLAGLKGEEGEDNMAGAAFNIFAFMHTEELIEKGKLPKELNDLPNYKSVLVR